MENDKVKEIDHEYTHNIICPYCGYEDNDSWEFSGNDGEQSEIDCSCGKTYMAQRNISVDYSTFKMENDCEHIGTIFCDECGKEL